MIEILYAIVSGIFFLIFGLAGFLVERPWVAWLIAIFFGLLFTASWVAHFRVLGVNYKSLLMASVVWTLYALWEASLAGRGMNIRCDMLIIYPILIVVSVFGIRAFIFNVLLIKRAKQSSPQ